MHIFFCVSSSSSTSSHRPDRCIRCVVGWAYVCMYDISQTRHIAMKNSRAIQTDKCFVYEHNRQREAEKNGWEKKIALNNHVHSFERRKKLDGCCFSSFHWVKMHRTAAPHKMVGEWEREQILVYDTFDGSDNFIFSFVCSVWFVCVCGHKKRPRKLGYGWLLLLCQFARSSHPILTISFAWFVSIEWYSLMDLSMQMDHMSICWRSYERKKTLQANSMNECVAPDAMKRQSNDVHNSTQCEEQSSTSTAISRMREEGHWTSFEPQCNDQIKNGRKSARVHKVMRIPCYVYKWTDHKKFIALFSQWASVHGHDALPSTRHFICRTNLSKYRTNCLYICLVVHYVHFHCFPIFFPFYPILLWIDKKKRTSVHTFFFSLLGVYTHTHT